MEVKSEKIKMIIRSSTSAVATVGGDINRVALKVHVIGQRIIGLEGEVCGTKKCMRKTNTKVEGVEEVARTHAKKTMRIEENFAKMDAENQGGTERLEGNTENNGSPHLLL